MGEKVQIDDIDIDDSPSEEEIAERIENHPCMKCPWNVKLDCTVPDKSQCPAEGHKGEGA